MRHSHQTKKIKKIVGGTILFMLIFLPRNQKIEKCQENTSKAIQLSIFSSLLWSFSSFLCPFLNVGLFLQMQRSFLFLTICFIAHLLCVHIVLEDISTLLSFFNPFSGAIVLHSPLKTVVLNDSPSVV